ncbi:PAS domain-containing protein [Thalassobius sp. I31.1]|uniref:PAS domain-containing protein n=1 Tax=Thalassobius sp. I31.1 TaxID=2109912 RepID=UPI000D1B14EF|nr:PAS domain-containing protein [Thalassobius sp. I31.1]
MTQNNDGNNEVVTLSDYRGQMTWSALKQVEAYWEGLRHGRVVPLRTDVDPRGIEGVLEHAFILERIAPGLARFRLAGLHLVDLIGMEVRGMPLTSFFTPDSRKKVTAALEDVFQGPETAEIHLTGEKGFGKPDLTARMLLLPLKSDLGDVSRILGCLVAQGQVGRTPRRFDVSDIQSRPIQVKAPEITRRPAPQPTPEKPEVVFQTDDAQKQPGFAEDSQAFTGAPSKTASYLRLVTDNDQR